MKDGTHCCPERSVEYQLELLLPTTYHYVFVCLHFGILYRYLLPTAIRYSRLSVLGARYSVPYSVLGTIQVNGRGPTFMFVPKLQVHIIAVKMH
jgi:hypothetical protein